jgi:hypothetical protein
MGSRSPILLLAALLVLLALCLHARPAYGQTYSSRVAAANRVGMTLTNYGVLGNNFTSRAPSFAYPLGAGFEHMSHGGLWVGAIRTADGSPGVTTGCVDAVSGGSTTGLSEFSPVGNDIGCRSSLPNNPCYDYGAVSEMDYLGVFDDLTPNNPTGEPHVPLRVGVKQYVYSWDFGPFANVLFFRYVIGNAGPDALSNVWVGLYTELASGNQAASASWPPAGWFSKKWLAYDADLRMVREHYCAAPPEPVNCNLQAVPYWAGVQLLTPPRPGQQVTLAGWSWSPGDPSRDQDTERYALMSAGTIVDLSQPSMQPLTGDPCELLALGPFATLAAGDSIAVDFAILGAADPDSIRAYAAAAQTLYDAGYDISVGTRASLQSAEATAERVLLRWQVPAGPGASVVVQRREPAGEWADLAEVTPAGEWVSYEDRAIAAGARYGYRLKLRTAAAEAFTAETWIDVPLVAAFALAGCTPNPAPAGEGTVAFSLAGRGVVRLACFDALGRREAGVSLGELGPGAHVVRMGVLGALRPGVHLLRLEQGEAWRARRVVVIR